MRNARILSLFLGVVGIAAALPALRVGYAEEPSANRAKKVLLIGIDGCRADALLKAEAPSLHSLRKEGAYSDAAQTGDLTWSGPGWSSMLTGVWRSKHGVRGNDFVGKNLTEYPSFLDRAKKAKPTLRTASFATWAPIHDHIIAAADAKVTNKADAASATAACKELQENQPDIMFVDFDDVDHAGHAHGFGPDVPQYLKAIKETDARVGELLKAVRGRKNYPREDWLVLVTTDHGGSGKSHGRDIPEHRTIFFIAHGSAINPGEIKPAPGVVDTAVTALTHIGVPIDPAWKLDGNAVGLKAVPKP